MSNKSQPSGVITQQTQDLFHDLRKLIVVAREQLTSQANASLTQLYWYIGQRITQQVLENQRADYGKQVIQSISQQLSHEFGKGFQEKNWKLPGKK